MKKRTICLILFSMFIACDRVEKTTGSFPKDSILACSMDMSPTLAVNAENGILKVSNNVVEISYLGNDKYLNYGGKKVAISPEVFKEIVNETNKYSEEVSLSWFRANKIKYKNHTITLSGDQEINSISQALRYKGGILFSGNAWKAGDHKLYWIIGYFQLDAASAQIHYCTTAVSNGRLYLVDTRLFE